MWDNVATRRHEPAEVFLSHKGENDLFINGTVRWISAYI
jgi:hypothetical protein